MPEFSPFDLLVLKHCFGTCPTAAETKSNGSINRFNLFIYLNLCEIKNDQWSVSATLEANHVQFSQAEQFVSWTADNLYSSLIISFEAVKLLHDNFYVSSKLRGWANDVLDRTASTLYLFDSNREPLPFRDRCDSYRVALSSRETDDSKRLVFASTDVFLILR